MRESIMRRILGSGGLAMVMVCTCGPAVAEGGADLKTLVQAKVQQEYDSLLALYKDLHLHPEVAFHEEKTSAKIAEELRKAGYEVATRVGVDGVVGVLRNGSGPTVLLRMELDALPVKEQTGLPYASSATCKNEAGDEVPVMHACGHDMNMTCVVGAARVLPQIKDQWSGTLVVIGQPAEERGRGARAMLTDGLFKRFPVPNCCLTLHDDAEIAAGTLGLVPGYAMANVDSVDIIIHGVGGHGAYPHKTKDPVVLAAQIVLALQTIVSREIQPGEPAVVTVGSIHGGTRHNIIPDQVTLQLTLRSYSDAVRQQTIEAIQRIVRGEAIAAGIPEDRLPEVKLIDDSTPSTYNDPQLTERLAGVFVSWFGETNVLHRRPSMGGEDFSEYGRTEQHIPICTFQLGGVDPQVLKESQRTGKSLPSLHSSQWAPLPQPTIVTGVTAMTAATLELMKKP